MRKVSKHIRILVAEDDPVIHREICQQIEEIGHVVVGHAYSKSQVLEQCKKTNPDILLLDIVMPDSPDGPIDKNSGIEIARTLHESHSTAIIWLTVYESQEIVEEASQLGLSGYLLKPVSNGDLARAIAIAYARFKDMQKQKQLNSELQAEVDARKKAEQEMIQLQTQLRQTNNAQQKLLGIIGHDLKNAFNSILLGAETISQPDIDGITSNNVRNLEK